MRRTVYNDEHKAFGEAVAAFLASEVTPYQSEWEEAGVVPRKLYTALARLGVIDLRLERYQHAEEYLQQALALFQKRGSTVGEVVSVQTIGHLRGLSRPASGERRRP